MIPLTSEKESNSPMMGSSLYNESKMLLGGMSF
jgi:hypothetical protein